MIIANVSPVDRGAWLAWRQGGVGASDVAAAHTGRYGGATKVVADRLGLLATPPDRGSEGTP